MCVCACARVIRAYAVSPYLFTLQTAVHHNIGSCSAANVLHFLFAWARTYGRERVEICARLAKEVIIFGISRFRCVIINYAWYGWPSFWWMICLWQFLEFLTAHPSVRRLLYIPRGCGGVVVVVDVVILCCLPLYSLFVLLGSFFLLKYALENWDVPSIIMHFINANRFFTDNVRNIEILTNDDVCKSN